MGSGGAGRRVGIAVVAARLGSAGRDTFNRCMTVMTSESANILCIGKISIWRRSEAGVTPVVAARLQHDPYIEGNPTGEVGLAADPQSPLLLRLLLFLPSHARAHRC
ncbi:hypothetical protein E2C01_026409 [Portunus trituberculatus]|uniref:Uncharacterized protein n=1 Tax=Portunus trituberculatus TaxID=210409 RepID=A0A5B7EIS8_PORTR|nr:hypothetical protein [Portunus trituberculatus]